MFCSGFNRVFSPALLALVFPQNLLHVYNYFLLDACVCACLFMDVIFLTPVPSVRRGSLHMPDTPLHTVNTHTLVPWCAITSLLFTSLFPHASGFGGSVFFFFQVNKTCTRTPSHTQNTQVPQLSNALEFDIKNKLKLLHVAWFDPL